MRRAEDHDESHPFAAHKPMPDDVSEIYLWEMASFYFHLDPPKVRSGDLLLRSRVHVSCSGVVGVSKSTYGLSIQTLINVYL